MAFRGFGAECGAGVVGGEFSFDDGFSVAFEEADYLGEMLVFGFLIVVVATMVGIVGGRLGYVRKFSARGVNRNVVGINEVLMIWIVGLGGRDGRDGSIVCFANAEECNCDLVVGWDPTENITVYI